ncbi:MAG TPA: hypothetical protein VLA24_15515 [Pseudomonadales bacterium]|nr:hypothetical protein [Pseudomonadales bacterium]
MTTLTIKWFLATTMFLSSMLIIGCDTKSELSELSDREMRAKVKECKTMKSPAPAMIFACENYQRECEKRADKAGHFVC